MLTSTNPRPETPAKVVNIEVDPPQRQPGEIQFIVNSIEVPTMLPTGSIQFALPMGIEDWEGEDAEDVYEPLWIDQQKMIDARDLLKTYL
jgi:hypothetical protein